MRTGLRSTARRSGHAVLPSVVATAICLIAPQSPALHGARAVGDEDWPFVVKLGDRCTGVLVDPRVVVYAGHCGTEFSEVRLGTQPSSRVAVRRCVAHADSFPGTPQDIALCVLSEPLAVPVPRLPRGCSKDRVALGARVTVVGYGLDALGQAGKRESVAETLSLGDMATIGAPGTGICDGDSGSPALACRGAGHSDCLVLGIASATTSPSCGARPGRFVLLEPMRRWIEEQSGVQLPQAECAEPPRRRGLRAGAALLLGLIGAALWRRLLSKKPR